MALGVASCVQRGQRGRTPASGPVRGLPCHSPTTVPPAPPPLPPWRAQSTGTGTAAEARPNAYIPEDIGIPKPYGAFTPFKPTDAGSSMRHIRKPMPKEIVI